TTAGNAALTAQARSAAAQRRARQVAALAEFARASVADANVAEAVHALSRLAAQALQVKHAAVFRVREDGTLALELADGAAATRELQARALQVSAAETLRGGRALAGSVPEQLPGPAMEGTGEIGPWALHPLAAFGRAFGVLAAWDGPERHPASPEWEPGDLDTLAALADQAAVLFEHARRLDELTAAERKREALAMRLREQDRLAARGEEAARGAREGPRP